MKRYTLGLALLGLAGPVLAQSEADALRFSRQQFGGTARTQGIGGATVALGADYGTVATNPAGLGLFQRSEISVTPALGMGTYKGQADLGESPGLSDSRNALQLGSLGVVVASRLPDDDNTTDWRSGAWAVGFTRLNDFSGRHRYRTTVNDRQSFFQRLREPRVDTTQIFNESDAERYVTLDGLAYGGFLTALNSNGRITTLSQLSRPGPVTQTETVETSGGQTQFDIAYGASYRDRLYIGGAFSVVTTNYEEQRDFAESYDQPDSRFGSLSLRDNVDVSGSGWNLRVGAIYRATDWVRVGASVQSPTIGSQTITYNTSLRTVFQQPVTAGGVTSAGESVSLLPSEYEYRFFAPWRASGGAAFILGKYGFVSGDVEYVDYASARFREQNIGGATSDAAYFDGLNDGIRSLYKSTVNLRAGGELRLEAFRLRLGYARYGDPYQENDFDRTQQYFTGGLGLRQKSRFIDVAGVYTQASRYYSPYTLADASQPVVAVKGNRFTTSVTVGFQF